MSAAPVAVVAMTLSHAGCDVLAEADGETGLAAALAERPALVCPTG